MLKSIIQFYKILLWHKRTFPEFTYQMQQEKLAGEIHEYEAALESYIKHPTTRHKRHVSEELADIVIAATNLYRYPEMRKLVAQKMIINHERAWNNGQHKIDYRQKYLESFFNWQNICALKDKRIEELEDKIKELEKDDKKNNANETHDL